MSCFALWGRTLKVDAPEFWQQTFLLAQPKGMDGSLLKCVLDAVNGHLSIRIIGLWKRR